MNQTKAKSLRHRAREGSPALARLSVAYLRAGQLKRMVIAPFLRGLKWYFCGRGVVHSYDITPVSRNYLIGAVSDICGVDDAVAEGAVAEIEDDSEFAALLEAAIASTAERYFITPNLKPGGKRLAFYALTRLLKPRCVVESGIDRGHSTAIIARALQRNAAEGRPGGIVGLDIHPSAGALVPPALSGFVDIRYGDGLESMRRFDGGIDLFIHDSFVHQPEEYGEALARLSPNGLLVSCEAATTTDLYRFARDHGLRFLFWEEETRHPYGGRGLGFAWRG